MVVSKFWLLLLKYWWNIAKKEKWGKQSLTNTTDTNQYMIDKTNTF